MGSGGIVAKVPFFKVTLKSRIELVWENGRSEEGQMIRCRDLRRKKPDRKEKTEKYSPSERGRSSRDKMLLLVLLTSPVTGGCETPPLSLAPLVAG